MFSVTPPVSRVCVCHGYLNPVKETELCYKQWKVTTGCENKQQQLLIKSWKYIVSNMTLDFPCPLFVLLFKEDVFLIFPRTVSFMFHQFTYHAFPWGISFFWDDATVGSSLIGWLIKPILQFKFSWDGFLTRWGHRDGHGTVRTVIHPEMGRWCTAIGWTEHQPMTDLSRSSERTCIIRVSTPARVHVNNRPSQFP